MSATSSLKELVEAVTNADPARSSAGQVFTYIDLGSVDQQKKEIVGLEQVPCEQAPSRAGQLVSAGDVLVSTVRPNLNGVARVPSELDGATASTGFTVLRPRAGVLDGGYLFHWVRNPKFVDALSRRATGASYPAVTDKIVKESEIPLRPIEEQRRIAAVLDQADELRAKRRVALALLESLTESIFLDMFGDPVTNPKGWDRMQLGDLLSVIDSGKSPICLSRPAERDEWGVLKLGAVTWCEYDEEENKALPPHVAPDERYEVRSGDVLFARKNTRELVGACALVRATRPRLLLSDLIFRLRLRPSAPVLPSYLHRLLVVPSKRRELQKLAGGSAGSMPNISKTRLLGIDVELPPLSLQKSFANRTLAIWNLQEEASIASAHLDELFASLQHRAFRGQL